MSLSKCQDFRVILHMDIDTFQIQTLRPGINLNNPIVAIDAHGLILSATKAAKDLGFQTRTLLNSYPHCPELTILNVPLNKWDKPYEKAKREASYKFKLVVARYFQAKNIVLEVASPDELFLDVTALARDMVKNYLANPSSGFRSWTNKIFLELPWQTELLNSSEFNSWSKNYNDGNHELNLLMAGAVICMKLAGVVLRETRLKVSCGVGENKFLAKIATTLHRPQCTTILQKLAYYHRVSRNISVTKIPGLGGETKGPVLLDKFGDDLTPSDLRSIRFKKLARVIGQDLAQKLKFFAQGTDDDPVIDKFMTKHINCANTLGYENDEDIIRQVISDLTEEILDRNLEERRYHHRLATVLKIQILGPRRKKFSHQLNLTRRETNDLSGQRLADRIMDELEEEEGFQFGRYYVSRINLTIIEFQDLRN